MAAANKAPPYPKQKYNDAKFREIIPQLTLAEYLKVEYLSKGTWRKMISKQGNFYNCECCAIDKIGPTPIIEHIRGKKHRFALQTADHLFHPKYTVPKSANTKEPAAAVAPVLDAHNGSAKQTKDAPAKAAGTNATKATAFQKTTATAAQKTTAPSEKTITAAPQKTGPQKKIGPASKTRKNEAAKSDSVQNKANASQSATENQSNETAAKPTDNKTTNDDNTSENSSESKPKENDSKVSTAAGKKTESNEPEVVVLDDDDEDISIPAAPSFEGKAAEKSTGASSSQSAKPQRTQKRNGNSQQPEQNKAQPKTQENALSTPTEAKNKEITPSNKVINPAAVLAKYSEKEKKDDENAPRYQQNRVLIPTIDKTRKKASPLVNKQMLESSAPSFSTKSFNLKAVEDMEGIIGVEYVVKILKVYNDPEPFYECCLCEVVMDGIGMQTHLLGYNHRYKYIEKHFPTCFGQYKEHIGNIQVMGIILDRIAKEIEAHHGRELPYECLSGEFRSNRHGVMTTVYSFRHASEYSGPSFTNAVDSKQIQEFYNKKNVYNPPRPDPKRKPTFDTRSGAPETKRAKTDRPAAGRGSASSGRRAYRQEPPMDDAVHKQMVEEFLQNTRGRSRSPGGRRRRHRTRSRSRSRSPHNLSRRRVRRSPSPLREGDVWQAYRHLVDRSKVELDDMYREYRKDPEKHPLYNEEWRKFWKHRKEQMASENLDYRNYDFQPEWVRYFAVRIEELYDEAVEDIKVSSRKRLILPMSNDELEDKRYHVKAYIEERQEAKPNPAVGYPQMQENKTSVVSVLRLLTALEDYLGSLGPRVVDLLSKALLVEKSNPRDINEIVLSLENCTILETAMEKLKGVLIAGLLEGPKVRAFNNVITETERILKFAFRNRQRNPQPLSLMPQPVPAPKSQMDFNQPKSSFLGIGRGGGGGGIGGGGGGHAGGSGSGGMGVGGSSYMTSQQSNAMGNTGNSGAAASLLSQVDKKELATKLAAALTAQGKTDFNPEQLQQLIAVYSLIDKKKRDSAHVVDKQKMTLSDTLTALLNPSEKNVGGGGGGGPLGQSSSGRVGGNPNYSNNSNDRMDDRPGSFSNSSINNFVSMMNRDNPSVKGTSGGADSQMWQNLQNIQNSIRMQNPAGGSSNTGGGYGNSSMGGNSGRGGGGDSSGGAGGVGGGSGYMDNMPSGGGNFNRSGGYGGGSGNVGGPPGGSSGYNSSQGNNMNFNRGGPSGGGGDSGGFNGNFRDMGNSNYPRGGGNDMLVSGGRGPGSGMGGNSGNFSSGGGGGGGMGLSGFNRASSGNSSSGCGGGGGSSVMGAGMGGGGSNSNFSRGDNFMGGGNSSGLGGGFGSNFSGGSMGNFSTGGLGAGSSYQRSSLGMGDGNNRGLGMSGNAGGSNFNRGPGGGANVGPSNFSGSMNSVGFSNKNMGSSASFGLNQRNMAGGNQPNNQMGRNSLGGSGGNAVNPNNPSSRGGSNWRNQ